MITFKAESRLCSVVVSFSPTDLEKISNGSLKRVIRKRYPRTGTPDWIYLWAKAPVSAIVGRAPIIKIGAITRDEALQQHKLFCLSREEVKSYCANCETLGVFVLGAYEHASTPQGLRKLSEAGRFHPPQSFLYLSGPGEKFLCAKSSFKLKKAST